MKTNSSLPAMLVIAALVGACSSMPKTTTLLDETRSDFLAVQSNPKVASYAPLELKQASDAMEQANAAANKREKAESIDKLAYLAKQKIALTREVTSQRVAEADVANAGKERDQIRLEQRTNEADKAKESAEQAKLAATFAKGDADEARRKAQIAQADSANAQMMTEEALAHAAKLEAQLADLAAKKTERGIIITLGDVLFGTDLARLNAEGLRTAQKLADVLQQNPLRTVLVEGFADSTGTTAHNQELSERRASAVRSALQDMGVALERVAMRGYGEEFPVAANDTSANRQLNRRVEIVLSDDKGMISKR